MPLGVVGCRVFGDGKNIIKDGRQECMCIVRRKCIWRMRQEPQRELVQKGGALPIGRRVADMTASPYRGGSCVVEGS